MNPALVDYHLKSKNTNALQSGLSQVNQLYGSQAFGDVLLRLIHPSGNVLSETSLYGKGDVVSISPWKGGWLAMIEYRDSLNVSGTLYTSPQQTSVLVIILNDDLSLDWLWDISSQYNMVRAMDITNDADSGFWVSFGNINQNYIYHLDHQYIITDSLIINNAGWFTELECGEDGALFFAGSCASSLALPDTVLSIPFAYNSWVVCMNSDLSFSWAKYFSDITCSPAELIAAPNGGVFFARALYDTASAGAFFLEGPVWGNDFMLLRIDRQGNVLWAREAPQVLSDISLGNADFMDADAFGNIYLTGSSRGTIDWGNAVLTQGPTPDYQVWIISFDSLGLARWTTSANSTGYEIGHSIAAFGQDEIMNAGTAQDSAVFGSYMISCSSWTIPYIAFLSIPTSLEEPTLLHSDRLNVFPNPTSRDLTIAYLTAGSRILLYSNTGQKLREYTACQDGRMYIRTEGLRPGLYILGSIDTAGVSHSVKLIIQ